jgi:RNA polymerase sigma-70 factor (ECF subfamily)
MGAFDHSSPVVSQEPVTAGPSQGACFEKIYEAEKVFVWNLMYRFGVPPQDREDLFQEVFLRAFRQPDALAQGGSPRPWLMGIAFRVASEWRRSQRRHGVGAPTGEEPSAEGPDPEQQLREQQEVALVERALQRIELERRAVFIAFELEEIPVPEIAASLGIPLNTAYSRLRLARQEFAEAIRKLHGGGRR